MSETERKIADTGGKFALVVKNGRKLDDAGWRRGRILLSNRRLVLITNGGKKAVPLSAIEGMGDRYDVNDDIARETEYTSLELDDTVILVTTEDDADFREDLYVALLDQSTVLARHPAVKGGVVQDTEWEEARFKLQEEKATIATESGTFVEIHRNDVGELDVEQRTVKGETRPVVEVEHQPGNDIVRTYLSGEERQVSFLESLFEESEERHTAELDLTRSEEEVLMALYSGVSTFELTEFTGMSVEEIEDTFDRLIELDVLEEVRTRREVALTTRGRNVASTAINDE